MSTNYQQVDTAIELQPRSDKADSPVTLKSSSHRSKTHDEHDQSAATLLNTSSHDHDLHKASANDSLSDTATNTSDEFDWDAEDDAASRKDKDLEAKRKTRRGRKIYGLFMKLSRTFRTFLVAVLGAGIFIAPLLVVTFKFHDSVVRPHVHMWSLWLSIIWAAASVTYLVVDLIPRFIIFIVTK